MTFALFFLTESFFFFQIIALVVFGCITTGLVKNARKALAGLGLACTFGRWCHLRMSVCSVSGA